MKLARWADMNALGPYQSLLVYKKWEAGRVLVDTHRLPDPSVLCTLFLTFRLMLVPDNYSIISSRNMQEYYNDNSPTKSGGKLDYYNIDWLSGVIIDRTVVLHELRFEDYRHRHSR